jgi:hypothetical protein
VRGLLITDYCSETYYAQDPFPDEDVVWGTSASRSCVV